MARLPRLLVSDRPTVYHVMSRTALPGLPFDAIDKDDFLARLKTLSCWWEGMKVGKWEGGKVGRWESGRVGRCEGMKVGKWEGGKVGEWEGGKVGRWALLRSE